jgi:hypothetical protein
VIMLVRPDRFCMACERPGHAEAALSQAHDILCVPMTY